MRVKLLIATIDQVYAKQISDIISRQHTDVIEVCDCSTPEGFLEVLSKRSFDVALIDSSMIEYAETDRISLPMLLYTDDENTVDTPAGIGMINKHQRISTIVAIVLERYARICNNMNANDEKTASITAVWSPVGGVGKTTIALAYCFSKLSGSDISKNNDVFYLNLEDFSSVPGYFKENGKSISTVFEMLENEDGNTAMLVQGTSCRDKGITFLCCPENFDDMCILSSDNVQELLTSCSQLSDTLVVDLSSACDCRAKKVFELADTVMIISDKSVMAEVKLSQFLSQSNVYESIKDKVVFVANKGAAISVAGERPIISLPHTQSSDVMTVCKSLSSAFVS